MVDEPIVLPRHLGAGRYVSLDDGSNGAPLIIDEAQRSRKLPLALKRLMLTGSSNMFATQHVVDSLAGRVRTLTRWPKRYRAARPRSSIGRHRIRRTRRLCRRPSRRRGPAIRLRPQERLSRCPGSRAWKATEDPSRLLDTVVDRDVADIVRIRRTDALRRLIHQLAGRTGTELNVSELCEIVGARRRTVEQYPDVLIRLSLVVRLGAWTSGESRREIKNAKHHRNRAMKQPTTD